MSYKIIVSRYNENIDWLSPEMYNCIIYNKGVSLGISNEIMLLNVGRESDTYLEYIISNYNNLPDVVVFTQARISDHRGCDNVNYLIHIKNDALQNTKSNVVLNHYDCGNNRDWDKNWNVRGASYYLHDNYKNNNRIVFIDWFKKHINSTYPNPIIAIFKS